jgi:hypothetical protein
MIYFPPCDEECDDDDSDDYTPVLSDDGYNSDFNHANPYADREE